MFTEFIFKRAHMSCPSGQMVKVAGCSLMLRHLGGSSVGKFGLHGFAVLLGLGVVLQDLN